MHRVFCFIHVVCCACYREAMVTETNRCDYGTSPARSLSGFGSALLVIRMYCTHSGRVVLYQLKQPRVPGTPAPGMGSSAHASCVLFIHVVCCACYREAMVTETNRWTMVHRPLVPCPASGVHCLSYVCIVLGHHGVSSSHSSYGSQGSRSQS